MTGPFASLRHRALSTTMLTAIAVGSITPFVALAADLSAGNPAFAPQTYLPAVDGINWKLGGFGGSLADRSIYSGLGSVSVPLGGQFGLQLDGAAGTYDDRGMYAGAGHLFWRDPTRGLIGLYGAATHWDKFGGLTVGQIAVEGEVYFGQWTIQGIAGVEGGNSKSETIGNLIETYDVGTRFFDKVNLAYYVNDNWKAFVGHRYLGGKHALALGSEFAFRVNGPVMASLFVEGRIGDDDFRGIWGGLRFYGGYKDKTLIQRHRQDDPLEWIPESLFSIVNSQTFTNVPRRNNNPPPTTPDTVIEQTSE